jgi:hypothetical protein
MPRGAAVALALALVMTTATAAGSQGVAPPDFDVVARARVYTGVEYVKLTKTNLPVIAHVARIAPGAPVDFRVVNAYDKISTSPRELETTSSMCHRTRCIVGVNGDFHRLGTPTGAVIADGRMLHSPDPGKPQLTMTTDGKLVAGPLPWAGSLGANGVQIPLTAVNDSPPADGLAVYTPAYGARTDPSSRTELVVGAPGGVASLNKPATLQLRGVRSGAGPIPADGAVLSADGAAGQQLRDIWARRSTAAAPAQLVVTSPIDARLSLGVEPVVLRDGRRALPWRDPNLIHPRQPHTLIGWNKAGDIYLVAVDGRQPGSDGVTMAEAADFLLDLGVTDAVNLDGGGGTTFVAGGSVWNRPSDNDPAQPTGYTERGGTNALVVTARPGAPLPPTASPPPEPLPTPRPGTPTSTGKGGGTRTAPLWDSPSGAVDGLPFGPTTGVGGAPAGDLPLASAAVSRSAATSTSSSAGSTDQADAAPPATAAPPAEGTRSSGGGGSERAIQGPALAASTLTRHLVGATVGGGSRWPLLGFAAGVALLAAATVRRPGALRRRR